MSQYKNTVIFDLFKVLVDWRHERAYKKVIKNPEKLDFFLENVIDSHFDYLMEKHSLTEAVAQRQKDFPEYAKEIALYPKIMPEMFNGYIQENLEIIKELKQRKVKLYLLSNLNIDALPMAKKLFNFWNLFDGTMISGEVGYSKPEPEIFKLLFKTFGINPKEAVFIDDTEANVKAARALGLDALCFETPAQVRIFLQKFNLL